MSATAVLPRDDEVKKVLATILTVTDIDVYN